MVNNKKIYNSAVVNNFKNIQTMKRILVIALVLMAINIGAYCQKDNGQSIKVNIQNKDNMPKSINTSDTLTLGKPLVMINKNKSFESITEWIKKQAENGYVVALSKETDGTYVAKCYNQNECISIKRKE